MESINNLKHHFLLAMPQINDQYFGQSVCYIFDHSERGSIGLIINKPSDVNLADIFSELAIRSSNRNHLIKPAILQGGPVSLEQGFVLYNGASNNVKNTEIVPGIRLSTSKEILVNIAHGIGPDNVLVCLGCASWEAGQLEAEITNNAWLTVEADETLLFHTPVEDIAKQAANKLGIDLSLLSSLSGRA